MNSEPDSVESKLIHGRGATSCLMCNKVCEHNVFNDLDIIIGVKMLYETDQYNIMLQSSIICIKCKGRMHQIFDFNTIKANIDDGIVGLQQSNNTEKCNFCNEFGFMKGNFRIEARRAIKNTKWHEAGTSSTNENCCFGCYNYLLLYNKFKGVLERQCVEFYRRIKAWQVRLDEPENIEELRAEFINLTRSRVLTQQTQAADTKSKDEQIIRTSSIHAKDDLEKEERTQAKPDKIVSAVMLKRLKMSDYNENVLDVLDVEDKFSLIKKRRSTERHNAPVQPKRRKNTSGPIKDELPELGSCVMVSIPMSENELSNPANHIPTPVEEPPVGLEMPQNEPPYEVRTVTILQNVVLQEKNLVTDEEAAKEETRLNEILVTVPSSSIMQEGDTLKDTTITNESTSIPIASQNDVEANSAENPPLEDDTPVKVIVEMIKAPEFSPEKVFLGLDVSDEKSNSLKSSSGKVARKTSDVTTFKLSVTTELNESKPEEGADNNETAVGQYFRSFMSEHHSDMPLDLFPEMEDLDVGIPPKCPKTQEDYFKQFGLKELSVSLSRITAGSLKKVLGKRAPKSPKSKTSMVTKSGRICKPKLKVDQGFVSKVKHPRLKIPSRPSPQSRKSNVARFETESGPDMTAEPSSAIDSMELTEFLSEDLDISIGYVDYAHDFESDYNVIVEAPREETFGHVSPNGQVHEDITTVEIIEVANEMPQPKRIILKRRFTNPPLSRSPEKLKQNAVMEFISPDRQGQGKLQIDGNHVQLIPHKSHSGIKVYRNYLVRSN